MSNRGEKISGITNGRKSQSVLKSVACLGVKKIRLVNVPTVQTITATNISRSHVHVTDENPFESAKKKE